MVTIGAMRVARPTADLARARWFYEHVVGLGVLWTFEDHDGFDGVIFGVPDDHAQLELVAASGLVAPAPSVEDLLVLYVGDADEVLAVAGRIGAAGRPEVAHDDPELNPYWPRIGARVFVDPDGYRLVVAPS